MSQRTWFITGVSSGFGRQLTDQRLQRGDRVVGTVRDTGKVADLVASLNDPTTGVEAAEAIRTLVDKVVVGWDGASHTIELVGELAALLAAGTNGNAAGLLAWRRFCIFGCGGARLPAAEITYRTPR